MRALLFLPLALSLYGCGGECRAPDDLGSGTLEGSLDGAAWSTSDATWAETGEQLLIGHSMVDGIMMSAVIHTTADSRPVQDLLEREEFPFDVILGEGEDGGWVTVYREGETASFHTQNAAGGTLTIASREGDDLLGCLHFSAATNEGDSVGFEDGFFQLAYREM